MLFLCGGGGGVSVLPLHLHIFRNIDVLAQRFCVVTELLFFACLRSILIKITRVPRVCEHFNLLCAPKSLIRCSVALFHDS